MMSITLVFGKMKIQKSLLIHLSSTIKKKKKEQGHLRMALQVQALHVE